MTQAPTRRQWLSQASAAALALAGPSAFAQSASASAWPNKAIKLIVPFNAGGATDISARVIAEKLSTRLGQPVLVDNRGGAAGILGTDAVAKAAPDGYTFVLSLSTSLLINQFLYTKMPYNPQRDLALVSQVADAPTVLVVNANVPVSTGPELMAYISKNKGKLSYGSWGVGSQAHLVGAQISQTLDADMSHVAYKGEAPMLQDLIGGQIQIAIASALGAKPHIDSGKIKALGVTGEQRMTVLPQVPTLPEQGLKDEVFRTTGWVAIAAPAKTPVEVVQRMSAEVRAVCALPEVRERFAAMGFTTVGSTPEQFAAFYKREYPVWERLVKASGAQLD
ncbi:tripartite tricarboxylate transporter substrate binding protein [Curvibacter sp. HBC28]|uniref:Tripartite tricarboxylate transporter substrate binding protein n=1 Tax=Curvibacter microcysteis TaxID=3026419 RepID=A0ABT5MPE0_9BURK|nr:tripartite tricarboxylate transporter substrate binding protein [Curvibacter sp. HBC28]MDD0817095.1 tripartite tricarboxylate transporter substrate binding protein [Curvibacter sp. HBC28]